MCCKAEWLAIHQNLRCGMLATEIFSIIIVISNKNHPRSHIMIYLTGDTHIPIDIDIDKLSSKSFPEQKQLTRDDFIVVLGDFGLLWREDTTYRYHAMYNRVLRLE